MTLPHLSDHRNGHDNCPVCKLAGKPRPSRIDAAAEGYGWPPADYRAWGETEKIIDQMLAEEGVTTIGLPEFKNGARTSTQIAKDAAAWDEYLRSIPVPIWAWFSGWTAADGSIKAAGRNKRPSISFAITDRDPLENFAEIFGGSVYGPIQPTGLGKKVRWEWKITGWRAHAMLPHMRPWLSARYVARADALASWSPRTDAGQKLTAEQVAEIKARLRDGEVGRRLAERFGVSDVLISRIKVGTAWSDVEPAASNGGAA